MYVTNAVTAERFNKIDVTGRGENIKSAGAASYRANRYLNTVSDVETDRIDVSVIVPPDEVNSILPFHRIQIFDTALPGYTGAPGANPTTSGCASSSDGRDIAPGWYELGLTLMVPAQDSFPDDEGGVTPTPRCARGCSRYRGRTLSRPARCCGARPATRPRRG